MLHVLCFLYPRFDNLRAFLASHVVSKDPIWIPGRIPDPMWIPFVQALGFDYGIQKDSYGFLWIPQSKNRSMRPPDLVGFLGFATL